MGCPLKGRSTVYLTELPMVHDEAVGSAGPLPGTPAGYPTELPTHEEAVGSTGLSTGMPAGYPTALPMVQEAVGSTAAHAGEWARSAYHCTTTAEGVSTVQPNANVEATASVSIALCVESSTLHTAEASTALLTVPSIATGTLDPTRLIWMPPIHC